MLTVTLAFAAPAFAAAQGLTLSFTTTPAGGNYNPKNIVAVWVEAPGGTFAKTILRWAGSRQSHLVAWRAKAGTSDTDAVSGATRPNHNTPATLTATWDGKNKAGAVLPDGTYTIRMELCDSNASTASQNNQGTFTFVKGPTSSHQTVSGGGFNNVVIDWAPITTVTDGGSGSDAGVKDAGTGGGGGAKDAGAGGGGGGTASGGGSGGAGGGSVSGGGAGGSGGGTTGNGGGTASGGAGGAGGGGAMADPGGCTSAVSAFPAVAGVLAVLGLRRRKTSAR